jgi:hypothetical protein
MSNTGPCFKCHERPPLAAATKQYSLAPWAHAPVVVSLWVPVVQSPTWLGSELPASAPRRILLLPAPPLLLVVPRRPAPLSRRADAMADTASAAGGSKSVSSSTSVTSDMMMTPSVLRGVPVSQRQVTQCWSLRCLVCHLNCPVHPRAHATAHLAMYALQHSADCTQTSRHTVQATCHAPQVNRFSLNTLPHPPSYHSPGSEDHALTRQQLQAVQAPSMQPELLRVCNAAAASACRRPATGSTGSTHGGAPSSTQVAPWCAG